jgi:hypothetical protein
MLFAGVCMALLTLSGCMPFKGALHDEAASSVNPNFAGSMKLEPGLFTSPQPLSETPGSRVREGD